MKIGFIGLGIMGGSMAANLLRQGHDLYVHNRTRSKAEPLLAGGAHWAETPAEAARPADVLISMLSDPKVVLESALGKDGFLDALKPGSVWIDSSTVDPAFSLLAAKEAGQRSVHFLDAPVVGSKKPAAEGQLIFFIGGSAEDVETCLPLFSAMGKQTTHVGVQGMGSQMKMVHNALVGMTMAAFSEVMALGQAEGIAREKLFEVLLPLPAMSPLIATKKAKIEGGTFEADFPLKLMHKDFQLITQTAYEVGAPMALANAAKEIYAQAVKRGLGDRDFSAVYRYLMGEV